MKSELQALENNGTWSITFFLLGIHPIRCKWAYKIKYHVDDTLEIYKAYLVVKGYNQQQGIDYLDVFSPIAKLVIVKVFLTLATIFCWTLVQLDVNNAFLYDDLLEEVYMSLPLSYHREGESLPTNVVCRLHKSLYGLKQVS